MRVKLRRILVECAELAQEVVVNMHQRWHPETLAKTGGWKLLLKSAVLVELGDAVIASTNLLCESANHDELTISLSPSSVVLGARIKR